MIPCFVSLLIHPTKKTPGFGANQGLRSLEEISNIGRRTQTRTRSKNLGVNRMRSETFRCPTFHGAGKFGIDPDAGCPCDLLDEFFEVLQRANLDDVAGGLGFEDHFFLGEGVDTLASLGGGLVDEGDLEQAGEHENAGAFFAQVELDRFAQRFEDASDLLARELGFVGQGFENFGLGCGLGCFGHVDTLH